MNMCRYELIKKFDDGHCAQYEDPMGYQILMYNNCELTKDLKCLDCFYVSLDKWFWQDIVGHWHHGITCIEGK